MRSGTGLKTTNLMRSGQGPKNHKFDEVWPGLEGWNPKFAQKHDKLDEVQNGPKNHKFDEVRDGPKPQI